MKIRSQKMSSAAQIPDDSMIINVVPCKFSRDKWDNIKVKTYKVFYVEENNDN